MQTGFKSEERHAPEPKENEDQRQTGAWENLSDLPKLQRYTKIQKIQEVFNHVFKLLNISR